MNCICQLDIRFRKDFGTPKSMKYRFHALFDTSVPIKIDPQDQLLICNAKKKHFCHGFCRQKCFLLLSLFVRVPIDLFYL